LNAICIPLLGPESNGDPPKVDGILKLYLAAPAKGLRVLGLGRPI